MRNLFQFGETVKKLAKKHYKQHDFVKEWQTFIFISIVLKILVMCFSVYAGYFYLQNLFVTLLNSKFFAILFAVLSLIILEVLTAISLFKFFKFALRFNSKNLKKAAFGLFLSLIFFSASFYSSTNGLALRQSKKTDNSEMITEKYVINRDNLKEEKQTKIAEIKEAINIIRSNPQGWTRGKRTTLLANQLASINSYYNEIKEIDKSYSNQLLQLENSYKSELSSNESLMNYEAKKYYNIVVVVMCIVFIINGLLMFFYSKTFNETEKELQKIEVIESFSDDIQDKTTELIENQINDTFLLYFSAMQNSFDKLNQPVIQNSKGIGFSQNNKNSNNDSVINDKVTNSTNQKDDEKKCLNCGKVFKPYNVIQKFCSSSCRAAYHKKKNGFDLDLFKRFKASQKK